MRREFFAPAEAVVVHGAENREESTSRFQHAVRFGDAAPHIFSGAVIEPRRSSGRVESSRLGMEETETRLKRHLVPGARLWSRSRVCDNPEIEMTHTECGKTQFGGELDVTARAQPDVRKVGEVSPSRAEPIRHHETNNVMRFPVNSAKAGLVMEMVAKCDAMSVLQAIL